MHSLNNAIPFVMERFDFTKVRQVMEFLKWTWAGNGQVPTINEMESTALYLLTGCVREFELKGSPKSGMVYATGGFKATVECFEGGEPQLELLFYVDKAGSNGEY